MINEKKLTNSKSEGKVQAAIRCLNILEVLARSNRPMLVKEISFQLKLNESTTYNLLAVLVNKRYAEHISRGRGYQIGPKIYEMYMQTLGRDKIAAVVKPVLEYLKDELGNETCHLCYFENYFSIPIAQVISTQSLACVAIDVQNELHALSLGKIFLSNLLDSEVIKWANEYGLQKFTPNTITSVERLLAELHKAREEGYAVNKEENILGIISFAVPVHCEKNSPLGLACSLPIVRYKESEKTRYTTLLKKYAKKLSKIVGETN